MKHKNIKQLDILWQEGIESQTLTGVIKGILEILKLAGVSDKIPIANQGTALFLPSRIDVESFLEAGRQESQRPGFLHAAVLLDTLRNAPNYQSKERYALLIVKEKLHCNNPAIYSEKGGCAFPGYNAVISLNSYWPWFNPQNFDVFLLLTRMIAIHEIGHIFGLGITRKPDATYEEIEDGHCKNACVMNLNTDVEFRNTIQDNPLCPSCLEKLRAYFTATP